MSLGLAVDLAKIGWNQGDDLYAYMDHRLAAGIEYLAAQTQSVEGLPWTNYMYGTNGYYYTDGRAWLMTGPALGAQMRPYWGTVIGIYEGVKGKEKRRERGYGHICFKCRDNGHHSSLRVWNVQPCKLADHSKNPCYEYPEKYGAFYLMFHQQCGYERTGNCENNSCAH